MSLISKEHILNILQENSDKSCESIIPIIANLQSHEVSASVGEYLKNYRISHKISQKRMANLMGTSSVNLSRLETGNQTCMRTKLLYNLRDILNEDEWQVLCELNAERSTRLRKSE